MSKRAFQIGHVRITEIDARVQQGLYYSAFAFEQDVPNNGFLDILIRTPIDIEPSFIFFASVGGDAIAYLYENTVVSDDGTVIVPTNHRRRTPVRASVTQTFKNPTVVSVGDPDPLIPGFYVPGGTTQGNRDQGGQGVVTIYQFAANTQYLARIQNISGGSQPVTIDMDYIEPVTGTTTGL